MTEQSLSGTVLNTGSRRRWPGFSSPQDEFDSELRKKWLPEQIYELQTEYPDYYEELLERWQDDRSSLEDLEEWDDEEVKAREFQSQLKDVAEEDEDEEEPTASSSGAEGMDEMDEMELPENEPNWEELKNLLITASPELLPSQSNPNWNLPAALVNMETLRKFPGLWSQIKNWAINNGIPPAYTSNPRNLVRAITDLYGPEGLSALGGEFTGENEGEEELANSSGNNNQNTANPTVVNNNIVEQPKAAEEAPECKRGRKPGDPLEKMQREMGQIKSAMNRFVKSISGQSRYGKPYERKYRRYPYERSLGQMERDHTGKSKDPSTGHKTDPATLDEQDLEGMPVEFEMNRNVLVLGKTFSGKTQFILQYLHIYWENFDRVVIYSSTAKNDPDYHEFREIDKAEGVNRLKFYESMDEDALIAFLDAKKQKNNQLHNMRYLIIFDDIVGFDGMSPHGKKMGRYFSEARHYDITTIAAVQNVRKTLPVTLRHNVHYIVLFKFPPAESKKVFEDYNTGGSSTMTRFLEEAQKITKTHGRAILLSSLQGFDFYEIEIDKFEGRGEDPQEEIEETDYPITYVKALFVKQNLEEDGISKIDNRKKINNVQKISAAL